MTSAVEFATNLVQYYTSQLLLHPESSERAKLIQKLINHAFDYWDRARNDNTTIQETVLFMREINADLNAVRKTGDPHADAEIDALHTLWKSYAPRASVSTRECGKRRH